MSESAAVTATPPGGRDLKPWLAPVAVVLFLVAGLGAIVVLSRRAAAPDAPSNPAPFTAPAAAHPMQAFDVQGVRGSTIRIASSGNPGGQGAVTQDLQTTPSTNWELLETITNDDIKAGDWVQLIGIPNPVRAFSIRSVVVTPDGGAVDDEGFVRSAGGFLGFEATQDENERPILAGKVTATTSRQGTTETARGLKDVIYTVLTLDGPSGTFTVDLQDGADIALYRIKAGSQGDVRDGDRLAYAAGDGPVAAVLVLPGGAQ